MKKKNKEITMGASVLIVGPVLVIYGYLESESGLSFMEYLFEVLIIISISLIIFGIILAIGFLIQRKGMFLTFRLKKRHRPKVILTPEDIKIAERKQLADSIDINEESIKTLKYCYTNPPKRVSEIIEEIEKRIEEDKKRLKKMK